MMVVMLASACGGDDDNGGDEGLVGTWKAISFSADISSTTTGGGADVTSSNDINGSNFDYEVTFTESSFTTAGGYDISITTEIVSGGTVNSIDTNDTYSDVDGSGTYSTNGDEITLNGSFYTFNVDGVPYGQGNEAQTAKFEINSNGQLVITQDETQTTTTQGINVVSVVESSSVWERQ